MMNFQILCLDANEEVKSKTIKTLIHALLANDKLFSVDDCESDATSIHDKKNRVKINVEQFDTSSFVTGARLSLAYKLSAESDNIEHLDEFRVLLIEHLKELKFSNIRILIDEVSERLSIDLYPTIYKLENHVRSFIVNFFVKNLGINWRELVMPKDTLKKILDRKNNDRIFVKGGKVDSDVILIDFDDLGQILYGEKSVLNYGKDSSKSDNLSIIIDKIKNATDLQKLKDEVTEGNYYKYFSDCFAQKDFENKWKELYYYRIKIAHNSYFSIKESDSCKNLCSEITAIIDSAYEKLDIFKLSVFDMEAFVEKVKDTASTDMPSNIESSAYVESEQNATYVEYKDIDEQTLKDELHKAVKRLPFVSLKYFVKDILGEKGYRFESSYLMVNLLADKGILVLGKEDNPNGEHDTTTITIIEQREE